MENPTPSPLEEALRENRWLQAQVTALQADLNKLVHARRDRRAQVMEFRRAVGLPVSDGPPCPPSKARIRANLRLIAEEFFEMLEACDVYGADSRPQREVMLAIDATTFVVDLPDFADALADLDYVIEGCRQEFGIDGAPIARAVHVANMAKLGGRLNASGKFTKPEGWTPPDIGRELQAQGWEPSQGFGPETATAGISPSDRA